jgi:hypothetical protein
MRRGAHLHAVPSPARTIEKRESSKGPYSEHEDHRNSSGEEERRAAEFYRKRPEGARKVSQAQRRSSF